MRKHKFLIVVGDSEWVIENMRDEELANSVVYNEDSRLKVVECYHEKFEDNCIEAEDIDDCGNHTLLRDVNGNLWFFDDCWSKADVINAFE